MVTEEQVMDILRTCYDPEIPVNIVDLGLIYGLEIEPEKVHLRMTLTAPFCPMAGEIQEEVREKIEAMEGVKEAHVEMVYDPPWTPERLTEAGRAELGFW